MILQVKDIKGNQWELFDPDGNSLGFVNEHQFNDIRIQAKEKKIGGYYCLFKNQEEEIKVVINENGKCNRWPTGFFDQWENALRILIKD